MRLLILMHKANSLSLALETGKVYQLIFFIEKTLPQSYNNENKNYHTIGTVPKSNRKIVEKGKIVSAFYILYTLIA